MATITTETETAEGAVANRKPAPPDLYTIPETLAALRVSRMTYYRLVAAGDLEPVKMRGAVRIRRIDVERLIANGGSGRKARRK